MLFFCCFSIISRLVRLVRLVRPVRPVWQSFALPIRLSPALNYRVCALLGNIGFHSRALTVDYLLKYLACVLFTLIMPDYAYLYLLLMCEIHMVMHLTCDKGVSSAAYSIVNKKVAGSAAYCHLFYLTSKQLIGHGMLRIEGFLYLADKFSGG